MGTKEKGNEDDDAKVNFVFINKPPVYKITDIVLQIEIILAENDNTIAVIIRKPGGEPLPVRSLGSQVKFQGALVAHATL